MAWKPVAKATNAPVVCGVFMCRARRSILRVWLKSLCLSCGRVQSKLVDIAVAEEHPRVWLKTMPSEATDADVWLRWADKRLLDPAFVVHLYNEMSSRAQPREQAEFLPPQPQQNTGTAAAIGTRICALCIPIANYAKDEDDIFAAEFANEVAQTERSYTNIQKLEPRHPI